MQKNRGCEANQAVDLNTIKWRRYTDLVVSSAWRRSRRMPWWHLAAVWLGNLQSNRTRLGIRVTLRSTQWLMIVGRESAHLRYNCI